VKTATNLIESKLSQLELPTFLDYSDAKRFCSQHTQDCHESIELCRYRFEKTSVFLNSSPSLIDSPWAKIFLYMISLWLRNNSGNLPRLVDFGGACGEVIWMGSKIFGYEFFDIATVIETRQMVSEAKNWNIFATINFSSCLEDHLDTCDVFFSSGAIMFAEDPYCLFETITSSNCSMIGLARNYFSENEVITPQISMLSHNGPGKHLEHYEDHPVVYPRWSIQKGKLIAIANNYGFKTILDTSSSNEADSGDLIFYRQKNAKAVIF
jgi:putative methyltransferase (TIGR04325 family)